MGLPLPVFLHEGRVEAQTYTEPLQCLSFLDVDEAVPLCRHMRLYHSPLAVGFRSRPCAPTPIPPEHPFSTGGTSPKPHSSLPHRRHRDVTSPSFLRTGFDSRSSIRRPPPSLISLEPVTVETREQLRGMCTPLFPPLIHWRPRTRGRGTTSK